MPRYFASKNAAAWQANSSLLSKKQGYVSQKRRKLKQKLRFEQKNREKSPIFQKKLQECVDYSLILRYNYPTILFYTMF